MYHNPYYDNIPYLSNWRTPWLMIILGVRGVESPKFWNSMWTTGVLDINQKTLWVIKSSHSATADEKKGMVSRGNQGQLDATYP